MTGSPPTLEADAAERSKAGHSSLKQLKEQAELPPNPPTTLWFKEEPDLSGFSKYRKPDLGDLGNDFQFGPPVAVAPGRFTKRTINPTSFSQRHDTQVGDQERRSITSGALGSTSIDHKLPDLKGTKLDSSETKGVRQALHENPDQHESTSVLDLDHDISVNPEYAKGTSVAGRNAKRPPFALSTCEKDDLVRTAYPSGTEEVHASLGPLRQQEDRRDVNLVGNATGPQTSGGNEDHEGIEDICRQAPPAPIVPRGPFKRSETFHETAEVSDFQVSPADEMLPPIQQVRAAKYQGFLPDRPMSKEPGEECMHGFGTQNRPASQCSYVSNISRVRTQRQEIREVGQTESGPWHTNCMDMMIKEFGENNVQSYNSLLRNVKKLGAKMSSQISSLEKELSEKEHTISEQDACGKAKDSTIQRLQDQSHTYESELQAKRKEVEGMATELQKCKGKCEKFKGYLNAMVEEQQDLYTRAKKYCQDSVSQIRAEGSLSNAAVEAALKKTEEIRSQMMERVRSEVNRCSQEAGTLQQVVQNLTRDLESKDAEIQRNKETMADLTQRLQGQEVLNTSFEALRAQMEDVLSRVSQQQKEDEECQKRAGYDQVHQSDLILGSLEHLNKLVSSQPSLLPSIQDLHRDAMDKFESKINVVIESQTRTEGAANKAVNSLETHISELWQHLDNKESQITQQLRDKSEENAILGQLLTEKEQECAHLETELVEAEEFENDQLQYIQELRDEISGLELSLADPASTTRFKELEDERARLTEEIRAKNDTIKTLETDFQAKEETRLAEALKYASETNKMAELLQEKDVVLRQATSDVLETVKNEAQLELDKRHLEIQSALEQLQRDKAVLIDHLQKSKQEVEAKNQKEALSSEMLGRLKERLSSVETRYETLKVHRNALDTQIEITETRESQGVSPGTQKDASQVMSWHQQKGYVQDRSRRVVVRSPAVPSGKPNPPTIEEEKTRRRDAVQPRSIMKPPRPLNPPNTDEENTKRKDTLQPRSILKRRPGDVQVVTEHPLQESTEPSAGAVADFNRFTRGLYNRPIAGKPLHFKPEPRPSEKIDKKRKNRVEGEKIDQRSPKKRRHLVHTETNADEVSLEVKQEESAQASVPSKKIYSTY